ncbi:MAG: hypothetical protein Q9172_001202 [Xanthocarpia lactea]
MDRITEYFQKHGTLNEQCEYDLAVVTELPAANDEDLQEQEDETAAEITFPTTEGADEPTHAFAFLPFKPTAFNKWNAEELEQQRKEEEAERQKKVRLLEEREGANEIAERVGEFFAGEGGDIAT